MSAKVTLPSRLLFDPKKESQHQWTSSVNTDIRARFEAMRRAARIQSQSPNVALIRRNQK
jgi:hypothetical protein